LVGFAVSFFDVLRATESMKVRQVVVGITTGLWLDYVGIVSAYCRRRWGICLFTKALRIALGPTQP